MTYDEYVKLDRECDSIFYVNLREIKDFVRDYPDFCMSDMKIYLAIEARECKALIRWLLSKGLLQSYLKVPQTRYIPTRELVLPPTLRDTPAKQCKDCHTIHDYLNEKIKVEVCKCGSTRLVDYIPKLRGFE